MVSFPHYMQGMILIVKMYCDQGLIHNVFMQEVNNNFHNGDSAGPTARVDQSDLKNARAISSVLFKATAERQDLRSRIKCPFKVHLGECKRTVCVFAHSDQQGTMNIRKGVSASAIEQQFQRYFKLGQPASNDEPPPKRVRFVDEKDKRDAAANASTN